MPREQITRNDGPFQLHIGWSRDTEYIEVTLRKTDAVDEVVGAVQMTRHQANVAVRTLRAARDAVYGKDE